MEDQSSKDCQDCNECLRILRLVTDNEADTEQIAFFNECIKYCEVCQHCYKIETGLRDCLKESLKSQKVPADLKKIIETQILDIS